MCHPPEKDEALHKVADPARDAMQEILNNLREGLYEIRNNLNHVELDNEIIMDFVRNLGAAHRAQIEANAQANVNGADQMNAAGEAGENGGQVENPAYRNFIDDDLD
ncbi:hypothetical protein CAEBREN_21251 [Caenorhabditis brenneri]|uniref:Uncharacterized protein n=1 Tax=Caenorhabditis brenneri TaxID=135651 RepID=G0MYA3_CAEBE|nr:hypothetical protein CAEBREN_21251 [Caenorhabditis brenneri]